MNKHSSHTVVKGSKDAFGLAILWRRVGAREPQDGTIGRKEITQRIRIVLLPVVSL